MTIRLGLPYRDKETKLLYDLFSINDKNEAVMIYTIDHIQYVPMEIFWNVFESV